MTRPAGSARLLRAINSSATLSHLLQAGQLTRAELRDRTGLSKPTSSEMLRLLTDAGLAVVAGRTAGGPGPTAEIYAPNADAAYVVALSVRDTTGEDRPGLGVAVADLTGAVRYRDETRPDFAATPPATVVADAVRRAATGAGIAAARIGRVEIGVAGSYDGRADRIHHIDVPGWSGPGIVESMRDCLQGTVPLGQITIENDVNLAAIAERADGAATTAESFALLWLDHGLGLALDLGDRLLRGARGGAGEIGYLPLPADHGPTDLQDLVGGPAVVDLARQHGAHARTPGAAVTAALDQPGGAAFLTELGRRIAYALATVVAVLDPPLVVLGGTVAQAGGDRLRAAVAAAIRADDVLPAPVRQSLDGVGIATTAVADDAVLLGAVTSGVHALHESLISTLAQPPE